MRTHNPNVGDTGPSRFRCVFAAISVADAITFAHRSVNSPTHPIKIFEIIARPESFRFRDMGWLDRNDMASDIASDYVSYWLTRLTLNAHDNPFIEVAIELPAKTGKIVDEITLSDSFDWRSPKCPQKTAD